MTIEITLFDHDLPDNLEISGDLAIDTETMGLNIRRDKLCLLQITNGSNHTYLVNFTKQNYAAPNLKKLLLDEDRVKIFHFARFDLAAIKCYLQIDLVNIFCTKIASKMVRTYTDAHGLKELCRELLAVQLSKKQQSSYWGDDNLTKDQQDYAAKDVIYLHQLRQILQTMLLKEGRLSLAKKVFAFLPVRAELDLAGWPEIDIFAH